MASADVGGDVAVERTRFSRTRSRRQLEFAGQRLGVPTEDRIVAEGSDDVVGRVDEENLGELGGRVREVLS